MSRLLGPFSVINNSVSLRACDFAGDQIAGAETALAAVSAVIDLRNSRRFMQKPPTRLAPCCVEFVSASRVPHCNAVASHVKSLNPWGLLLDRSKGCQPGSGPKPNKLKN